MEKIPFLKNTQVALFFENNLPKPEDKWKTLNDSMGNIFNATPLIIPIPSDIALQDIPVLQMFSEDRKYQCNLARSRADFFINSADDKKLIFESVKTDLMTKCAQFADFFSGQVKRIGFVSRFLVEIPQNNEAISKLISSNFKDLFEGKVHEAYVKYVSRQEFGGLFINNFTVLEHGQRISSGEKLVFITRDFNTDPENNYVRELKPKGIKEFIEFGERNFKLQNIISLLS